jgi:hypothetical protein
MKTGKRPVLSEAYHNPVANLISKAWEFDQFQRITAEEMLQGLTGLVSEGKQ